MLLAAVGDIHCAKHSKGALRGVFASMAESADVILLCGDLTDYGLPEEALILREELRAAAGVPTIAVLGNHDHESGHASEVVSILEEAGVVLLDGTTCEVRGVGFAGAKGFAGGFGTHMLAAWGEASIKAFVHEAVEEALRLETALTKLQTPSRVALLHYAPIAATVEGEPAALHAFLGTSRLEEALNRHPVSLVVHGHAHRGTHEGHTSTGVPVYNVAMPLLRRLHPDRPFRLLEV